MTNEKEGLQVQLQILALQRENAQLRQQLCEMLAEKAAARLDKLEEAEAIEENLGADS